MGALLDDDDYDDDMHVYVYVCMYVCEYIGIRFSDRLSFWFLIIIRAILRTHPRCVETKVMGLKVKLDYIEPYPPWSICPASPVRCRAIDGCSKDARVVL